MSYSDLLKIANIVDHKLRLNIYAHHYERQVIDGLFYINFIQEKNLISISRPNHSTHHEATSFLIIKKNSSSINTVKGDADDLKKFLDFLHIWNINLLDVDLYIILLGFIDYLKCIRSGKNDYKRSILWSCVKEIHLNQSVKPTNNVKYISYNKEGFMGREINDALSYTTIYKAVSTAVHYLVFLQQKTSKFKSLELNQLPVKVKYNDTMLSGTLGKTATKIFDIESMLESAGLKAKHSKKSLLLRSKIFSLKELDLFFNFIPQNHHQNRLLFFMLRSFGLRVGEAANIMLDTSTLPKKLLFIEYFEAREYLKNHLRGDIEYSPQINKWICYVVERNNEDYRSQHKSGSRDIPLIISEDLFLDLLLNALKEREILMRHTHHKHSFLFVSRHNSFKGEPINGRTIDSRFSTYVSKLLKLNEIDLTGYSPHSFRHFYATYLLRIMRIDIADVSRWLGHSSVEITREIYLHYIPQDNDEEQNTVSGIANNFSKEEL